NFLTYIQWPKDYRSGEIIIGILGTNEGIEKELKAIANDKKIGTRSITIKPFSHLGQFSKCHVLFIPSRQSAQIAIAAKKLGGTGTLLISSSVNGISDGADINFAVVNNKLGFELKPDNATKKNIGISSSLKRLATKVYE
ncbi:MAG: YfiR family protein, partial [Bacteroidales bacterium]|nr:YfiR family protein [Bacteroidales bacterium]